MLKQLQANPCYNQQQNYIPDHRQTLRKRKKEKFKNEDKFKNDGWNKEKKKEESKKYNTHIRKIKLFVTGERKQNFKSKIFMSQEQNYYWVDKRILDTEILLNMEPQTICQTISIW